MCSSTILLGDFYVDKKWTADSFLPYYNSSVLFVKCAKFFFATLEDTFWRAAEPKRPIYYVQKLTFLAMELIRRQYTTNNNSKNIVTHFFLPRFSKKQDFSILSTSCVLLCTVFYTVATCLHFKIGFAT